VKLHLLSKNFFLLFTVFFITCLLLEIALRIFPVPGTKIACHMFDEVAGFKYYPFSNSIYVGKKGKCVTRKANKFGYLDKDHSIEERDFYRVAFFGDSFTEALQLPLENTFFRIIEKRINNETISPKIEVLSFGVSSYSTLQSYLTCKQWMDKMDLDLIVYVFYENDLGDQVKQINTLDMVPYAQLDNGNLSINKAFIGKYSYKLKEPMRTLKFIRDRSFLLSEIYRRASLLKKQFKKTKPSENKNGYIPDQNDPPSKWPPYLIKIAEDLGVAVLLEWNNSVVGSGRSFCVLYVPREDQLEIPTENQDSWKKWLQDFCYSSNIAFIDPTSTLVYQKKMGDPVYDDHFSLRGHSAISDVFVSWFKDFKQIVK